MTLLLLADHRGLVFLPRSAVAMASVEFAGRVQVVASDGTVAHRPGPLSALEGAPLVPAEGGLVNPAFSGQTLPGGWEVPGGVAGPGPDPAPDPPLEGFPLRASEVLYLRTERPPAWVTDRGEIPCPGRGQGKRLARLHPDLRAAGRNFHVNPQRIRSLRKVPGAREYDLAFDEGTVLRLREKSALRLCAGLGLPSRYEVGGETDHQRLLRRLGVQRWPLALSMAPAAFLSAEFAGDPERLVANLLMQTVDARRQGRPTRDGDGHRPYWYFPAKTSMHRAGLLDEGAGDPGAFDLPAAWSTARAFDFPAACSTARAFGFPAAWSREGPLDAEAAFAAMCFVMTAMVESGLIRYRDLGFRERRRQLRMMGKTHPHLVVFVEKESLIDHARALHRRFGVTVFVSGGLPSLIGAEFLCEDLLALGVREVVILSYCDHDVVGHDLPVWFAAQLRRYQVATREIRRLITPDLFTPEEIDRYAVPLRLDGPPQWRARVRKWLEVTGGINGKALALHANSLQPLERVVAALVKAAGELLGPQG